MPPPVYGWVALGKCLAGVGGAPFGVACVGAIFCIGGVVGPLGLPSSFLGGGAFLGFALELGVGGFAGGGGFLGFCAVPAGAGGALAGGGPPCAPPPGYPCEGGGGLRGTSRPAPPELLAPAPAGVEDRSKLDLACWNDEACLA